MAGVLSPDELDRLVVVLVSTRNPLNIGAAARAMSNFGFSHLRVVHPFDPSFREAKSAVGASAVLHAAEEFTSVAEAIADCQLVIGTTAAANRELQLRLRRLEQGGLEVRRQLSAGRAAILFGSEKRGLSNEDLDHCHWLMRIPTRDEHSSMNLGQSVAICLYELIRESDSRTPPEEKARAQAGDLDRLTNVLLEALEASGYVKPAAASTTEGKLRRMIRRFDLNAEDAEILLGMLRKIRRKLTSG